jgi:hypothetical protein
MGRAVAEVVSQRLSAVVAQVPSQNRPFLFYIGYKANLDEEQIFSQYSGFPYLFLFHPMFHTDQSSEAGTKFQTLVYVPSGLSVTPQIQKEVTSASRQKFEITIFRIQVSCIMIRASLLGRTSLLFFKSSGKESS